MRKFQAPAFEIVVQKINSNISKNGPTFYSPRSEPVLYSINNKEKESVQKEKKNNNKEKNSFKNHRLFHLLPIRSQSLRCNL